MNIGVVVPCTDSKAGRTPVTAIRMLDGFRDPEEAATRWLTLLSGSDLCCEARKLYRGPGWAAGLSLVSAVRRAGAHVDWRIISAGYGLLHPEERVARYSATFRSGSPDSVPGSDGEVDGLVRWWEAVNRTRGQDRALVGVVSRLDGLVVAASATYVDALSAEVVTVAEQVPTVVFCAGRPRDPRVAALVPRFDRRLREGDEPFVQGGDVGFNQRVATRCVELLGLDVVDRVRVDEVLAAAMDREGPVRHGRQAASDAAVMAFIGVALAADPAVSRTALLRRWRDRGWACEQGRFGALYERVVAERDGQLVLGEVGSWV